MTTTTFEFDVEPTAADRALNLAVLLDGQGCWQQDKITQPCHVVIDLDDSVDAEHSLQFVISGKTSEHTEVDSAGNIVSDSMLRLSNIHIDGINITDFIHTLATYTHDFNGSGTQITDKMYTDLGCNGVAELKFSTPLYLWLLENI